MGMRCKVTLNARSESSIYSMVHTVQSDIMKPHRMNIDKRSLSTVGVKPFSSRMIMLENSLMATVYTSLNILSFRL